jgi:hypothetical protein
MVFNTTFNNISVISWRSVLLVEETGVPGENLSQVADKTSSSSHQNVFCSRHNMAEYAHIPLNAISHTRSFLGLT